MFIGEYRHSLDNKNRLIIPSKYREELGTNFIVSKGFDGCLTIYTQQEWRIMFEKIKKLPMTKKQTRYYIHALTSKAVECDLDKNGRIQLPQTLVNEANITKECVVVGVDDHVEIWAEGTWEDYYKIASDSFEEIAEELTEFLI